MILFMRSCQLNDRYLSITKQIEKAEEIFAKGLPNKTVYSKSEINSLDGYPLVINALIDLGILKLQQINIDPETGFSDDIEWDDDQAKYTNDRRWIVIGKLVKLIQDIKDQSNPFCFISFYADEGSDYANKLKKCLETAGINCFISSELSSGVSWGNAILDALHRSSIIFLIETENYHTRPRCQIERDFAIAKGMHLLRVVLCDLNRLNGIPPWLNDIQYEKLNINGHFNPEKSLFGISLPDNVIHPIRQRAAFSLIEKVTPDNVNRLASVLSLSDQLTGSDHNRKTQLVNLAFTNIITADRFCNEIKLDGLF